MMHIDLWLSIAFRSLKQDMKAHNQESLYTLYML